MQKLLIDEIFRALLFRDFDALDRLSDNRASEAVYLRLLMCSDSPGSLNIGIPLDKLQKEDPFIVSPFEIDRFIMISAHTALQAAFSGGKSNVLVDWSFSYDSNFAEKLRGFLMKEDIDPKNRDRIERFLKLRKELNIQSDLLPVILENTRLHRDDPKNDRPRNTIAAFKSLDHINWAETQNYSNIQIDNDIWTKVVADADSDMDFYLQNGEVIRTETKALFVHSILLEMTRLWFESPDSSALNFTKLIDFCVLNLGCIPTFELNIAWQFFFPKKMRLSFFGPIYGISKTMLTELKGMSWDLTHLRTLETMATQSKLGSFYLPYFITIDNRLQELIRLNPIRFILIDDENKIVLTARKNQLQFQIGLDKHMSPETKKLMTPQHVKSRREKRLDFEYLSKITKELEATVKLIFDEKIKEKNTIKLKKV